MNTGLGLGGGQQLAGGGLNLGSGLKFGQGGLQLGPGQQQGTSATTSQQTAGLGLGASGGGGLQLGGLKLKTQLTPGLDLLDLELELVWEHSNRPWA